MSRYPSTLGGVALACMLLASLVVGPSQVQAAPSALTSRRATIHPWERYVRGFRREHNFALTSGPTAGTWHIKHLGSMDGQQFESSGGYGRFQYGFHLPFAGSFGWILGTACGYQYEPSEAKSAFKTVPATIFPGVLLGMVYDFNPVLRMGLSVDASLERYSGLTERDDIDKETEVFITMQAYNASFFFDFFYDLAWAVRIEAHYRENEFIPPEKSAEYPVNANIRRKQRWAGLGLVYHLL